MVEDRKVLGKYLVDKGLITDVQLQEAMEEQAKTGKKLGEILINRDFVKEEDVAKSVAEQLGFAYVNLDTHPVEREVIKLVPYNIVQRYTVIPIFKVANSLSVAMLDPLDLKAVDELASHSKMRIKPFVSTATMIKNAITRYYQTGIFQNPTGSFPNVMGDSGMKAFEPGSVSSQEESSQLIKVATQAPVINLVNEIIDRALELEASDIHLEPQEKEFHCRFRVDGVMRDIDTLSKDLQLAIVSRIKIMANMDIAQSRLPQDGRVELKVKERPVDLRIATFPTIFGEMVAIRILDKSQGILKLEELGFEKKALTQLKDMINRPHGIVLVTGPTGSGKSTTLYAILNTINDLKRNIVTLEDPVEYTIPRTHQAQINVKAGLTFASGLRAILRVDPDIIMIGEIRDKETAEIAIHASLTGHIVFSTLHTNDAASAVSRLIDLGVEPYLVASSLAGVLAQRLVRQLCPICKKEVHNVPLRGKEPIAKAYEAVGCDKCNSTGYKGRLGLFELLVTNDEIKNLIVERAPAHLIFQSASNGGMKSLQQDGLDKVAKGVTSLSEVLSVTAEKS